MKVIKSLIEITYIHKTCNQYDIENYVINSDGTIDIDGDVDLSGYDLSTIPLMFNNVSGDFNCAGNALTTLVGCPVTVGCDLNIAHNYIKTLEYCSESVGKSFDCSDNKLTSLIGSPKKVQNFYCQHNKLINLIGSPIVKGSSYICYENKLTSLEGIYEKYKGDLDLDGNKLSNLLYLPVNIGELRIRDNKFPIEFIQLYYPLTDNDDDNDGSYSEKSLFYQYQHYFEIWSNGFDLEAMTDLVYEIKNGLL